MPTPPIRFTLRDLALGAVVIAVWMNVPVQLYRQRMVQRYDMVIRVPPYEPHLAIAIATVVTIAVRRLDRAWNSTTCEPPSPGTTAADRGQPTGSDDL
jgi:hypothetical protein